MRAAVCVFVLALAAGGCGYVRREPVRNAVRVETVEDGSRDRALSGKARVRARRG